MYKAHSLKVGCLTLLWSDSYCFDLRKTVGRIAAYARAFIGITEEELSILDNRRLFHTTPGPLRQFTYMEPIVGDTWSRFYYSIYGCEPTIPSLEPPTVEDDNFFRLLAHRNWWPVTAKPPYEERIGWDEVKGVVGG